MNVNDLRWAFFTYGNNLGDFSRAIELAKGMMQSGAQLHFFNHGGIHNSLLKTYKIPYTNLQPELSWEQHEKIMDINRYVAKVGTSLHISKEQWIEMTEADITAIINFNADAVFAGLNLSCFIAAPYLHKPYVTLLPTVNCPSFIQQNNYPFPHTMEKNFIIKHLIPEYFKILFMKKVLLGASAKKSLETFNQARKHFGLHPIYNAVELFKGTLTLLPDLPILSGFAQENLTPGYVYTGPIFSKAFTEIPPDLYKVCNTTKTKVFVSLGSSGFKQSLKDIISILLNYTDFHVICATTTICNPEELHKNNERFFAAKFLPALEVTQMVNFAITHGGQGTVQTTVSAGKPFIGIGFQAEQQANIRGIVKQGCAIQLPLYSLNSKELLHAINTINHTLYKENALKLKQTIKDVDGVKIAVKKMNEFCINSKMSERMRV